MSTRILLLDTGKEWGGGTNSMIELLKRLDRERFSVTCCFYTDYRKGQGRLLSEELAEIGVPLVLLPPRKQPLWAKISKELARGFLAWSPRLKKKAVLIVDMYWRVKPQAKALLQVLRRGRFDLLYMNNQPSSNLEGYFAAENANIPVVQHCRTTPRLQEEEAIVVNRVATHIICVSQGVAEILSKQLGTKDRLSIVFNAIDSAISPENKVDLSLPPETLVIGTVGRLTPIKAINHLLEAVARLRDDGISPICLIVGEGAQREELEASAKRLGIAGQVRFVGFQTNPLAWVQAMDVCVLCSSSEGLPRVVLEAMLARKPVVASCVTGTRELVIHERTGLLYPFGDISALTTALEQFISNAQLRASMGSAGHQRVVELFSIEAYVAGVSAVLEKAAR